MVHQSAAFNMLYATDAARWHAVLARDTRADGLFYYAVATTGIYCRVVCKARRPLWRNVRFFDTREAARAARYRPCKLCDPDLVPQPHAAESVAVRPAAILFADIKGFARLSAPWPAERTLELIDAFQRTLAVPIHANGGLVHKQMGDGLMAVFGDCSASPDDAVRACTAALAMRVTLATWNAERRVKGEPAIAVGIGVHYGMAAFRSGPQGADLIVGDSVNVASRLERATRRLQADLVVSEPAIRALPPDDAERVMPHFGPRLFIRLAGCRACHVHVAKG
jgi:adenylate cyclase